MKVRLGVNIDHVATVRNARGGAEPDPVAAAVLVELAGAGGITIHLREDRRHIRDRDLELLRQTVRLPLNLEMACTAEMIAVAGRIGPDQVTLVPERRQEITTEGGLGVAAARGALGPGIAELRRRIPRVSLFIDPEEAAVRTAAELGANMIELHTGRYCEAAGEAAAARELDSLASGAALAGELGLVVAAGHGLNYRNVQPVAALPQVSELNIGHSIIGRAILVGLEQAVRDMLDLIRRARFLTSG